MNTAAQSEFGPEIAGHAGRRSFARVPLSLPASLTLITGTEQCVLEDLSLGGASVSLCSCPKVGESGMLTCRELDAFFTVKWVRGNRCGLRFEQRLPKPVVLNLRQLAQDYAAASDRELREFGREWAQGRAGHSNDG